jgi:nucleoside-diphosphate-sugar epimerase
MKLLVVGGAGYVGRIIGPVLETVFDCTYFDIKPIKGCEDRTILADVSDKEKVQQAVAGMDAIIYLAMGVGPKSPNPAENPNVNDINAAFDVNVRGLYHFLYASLAAGTKRFIYVSTLSVYHQRWKDIVLDENTPADSWHPYGLSKRAGEFICGCAAQTHPGACITAIRLITPRNEQDWPPYRYDPAKSRNSCATGPKDTQRLFVAAANFDKPGFHLLQASGDISDSYLPNTRANELFGWLPKNE